MTERMSLTDLTGIINTVPNGPRDDQAKPTVFPLYPSSNSVASFMGSSIHPHDVADEEKWLTLKSSVRIYCQGLGKVNEGDDSVPNVACIVGAALNTGRSYRPCVTLIPSKNCTKKQRKATKKVLKSNASDVVAYVNTVSKKIFSCSMQIDTVISED